MCSNTVTTDLGLTDKNAGCACGGHSAQDAAVESASPAAVLADYLVSGMTCGHCVSSVTEELSALAGVTAVDVALNAGGVSTVTVASDVELNADDVRAALGEAGYELVSKAK
ncbi:MAG TPA: copper chaperone [Microbacteriaceae bacterium]|nr:copper chaperone [Microbacteriaceae bacterium]